MKRYSFLWVTGLLFLGSLIGHWAFGLPIGYALCFWYGWGVAGLWIGLSLGLVFVSVVLTGAWARRAAELA